MMTPGQFLEYCAIFGVHTGGGGGGSVTSITAGTGLSSSPNPITSSGTISLAIPVVSADGGTGLTTFAANSMLYASAANTWGALGTVGNGVLVTSNTGVPSFSSNLPSAVQDNIQQLGTQIQALSMGTFQINNMADPTSSTDAATKNYVDTVAAGLAPAGAVDAATTTNFAATYNNGSSGVGATLTATSTGAVTFDGQAVALNSDYLFKNQTTQLQNGIYTCTVLGAVGVAAVFTRNIHYDTPESINNTGIVPVISGSTQAGQGYYQTSTVVAVGTTPITYVNFGNSGTVTSITAGTGLTGGTITGSGTIALAIPVVVSSGGTGLVTTTAYGLITGGTTATGNFQNAGTGATGTMLQGAGASALPTFSTTTWPATLAINEILFSSAANVITGITPVDSAVMVSGVTGIPGWSTTLPSGLTIPGYVAAGANSSITNLTGLTGVLQAPTQVNDANGNPIMTFVSTASAVNYFTFTNEATANYPTFMATGSDSVVGMSIQSKGGVIQFISVGASTRIALFDAAGTNSVGFSAPTLTGNLNWSLPSADAAGLWQSNGSGVLSITNTPALGTPASGTLTNCTGYTVANLADTAWTDFSGTIGYTGFSGTPTTTYARYKKIGKTLFFQIDMTGTSNATSFTITGMPAAAAIGTNTNSPVYQAENNSSSAYTAQFSLTASSTTMTMTLSNNASGWTASGTKGISFSGFYETT